MSQTIFRLLANAGQGLLGGVGAVSQQTPTTPTSLLRKGINRQQLANCWPTTANIFNRLSITPTRYKEAITIRKQDMTNPKNYNRFIRARINLLANEQRFEQLKLQAEADFANCEYYYNNGDIEQTKIWGHKFKTSLWELADFYAKDAGMKTETVYEQWKINKVSIPLLKLQSTVRREELWSSYQKPSLKVETPKISSLTTIKNWAIPIVLVGAIATTSIGLGLVFQSFINDQQTITK